MPSLRPWALIAISTCLAVPGWAAAPDAPAAATVEPIFTRQTDFSIPFRIGPPKTNDQTPVEVLLGVSVDRGQSWTLASRVKPEQGSFAFRAPHDGEYWFSIRTVDRQGNFHPDAPPQAELKVTVDTMVPRLELAAARGAAGEIVVDWQAVDPNLRPESLIIEYQAGPNLPWEPLATKGPTDPARHSVVGQATWWPNPGAGAVVIRAQVVDRAGNPAVNQVQVKMEGAQAAANVTGAAAPPASPDPMPEKTTSGVNWPAEQSASPVGSPDRASPAVDKDANWRMASAPLTPSERTSTPGGTVLQSKTAAREVSHQVRHDAAGEKLDLSVLPPGERPQMVNSLTFEWEYEVESIGPAGIGKVELWGTRDGGRSWASFGVDSDNRSPLLVRVDSDGIYGFRIVVQSATGAGGEPPRPGELPEIWIGVDRTKPVVKLTGVEVGKDGTEMQIRWEAADELPDSRPISLLLSDRPGGPWSAFASGLENTDSYTWRLDSRVPDQLYLRIEVRDQAGNLGVYETAEPIPLPRQKPQGRLRSVRPVERGGVSG